LQFLGRAFNFVARAAPGFCREYVVAKKALIVWGGWDGHQPKENAEIFDKVLHEEGFTTEISDKLDPFADEARLKTFDLIVPIWTCGQITPDQSNGVSKAVQSGVGIAGCHGGMGDAFRNDCTWQFMTGGQFVAHPGNGIKYTVKISNVKSPITEGIKDFEVESEQYYMHVDPALKVLATTKFPVADGPHVGNGECEMPVVWTKMWGKGRVFYNSLAHQMDVIKSEPCITLMRRGFKWAAR
jgi:type 1 glutamine amidotransferase